RPRSTAKTLTYAAHRNGRRKAGGIDFLKCWCIEKMRANLCKCLRIALFIARIGSQIARIVKLFGIDEQRDNHPVSTFKPLLDQACMAFMQSAHGWNYRNAQPLLLPFRNLLAQLRDGSDNFQAHI